MKNEGYISIKHLAEQLGMDRSHARRYVLKLGFTPKKRRTADSGNQLTLTVTRDEADIIRKHREQQGFAGHAIVESEIGCFYVIQLVPELDPERIKLGFAIDLNNRLLQHRTAAPTATVLKSWPCRRSWETTVMDCLSAGCCRHILNEVFECEELAVLIAKGDALFSILPRPDERPSPSKHAPCSDEDTRLS